MTIRFSDFVYKPYQHGLDHAKIAFSSKETKVATKAFFTGETTKKLSLLGRIKHMALAIALWIPLANIVTHLFMKKITPLPEKTIEPARPHPMELRSHAKAASETEAPKKITEAAQEPNIEDVEMVFWELFTGDPKLQRVLAFEMAHGSGDATEKAEYLVAHYRSVTDAPFSPTLISKLTGKVKAQLATNDHEVGAARGPQKKILETGETLTIYNTMGDGSCGLHALLGEPDTEGMYATDAQNARLELRAWASKNLDNPRIDNVLDDYFTHFDIAPKSFQTAVKMIYNEVRKDYKTLSNDEKDARKASFKKNPLVRNAYLDNLQKVGTYLLQDELIAAAVCFQKKLVFHQPQHGKSGHTVGSYTIDETKNFSDPAIHIWYNGYNHYERAKVDSLEK